MTTATSSAHQDQQLKELFQHEADTLVGRLRGAWRVDQTANLNNGPNNSLSEARRTTHTLKSAAGAAGEQPIVQLAHRMEDLMDRLNAPVGEGANEAFELMHDSISVLELLVDGRHPAQADEALQTISRRFDRILGMAPKLPQPSRRGPIAARISSGGERSSLMLRRALDVVAQRQGKQIDLIVRGGEFEQQTRLWEELAAPLLHLLKNAADHGIEPPDQRLRQNKPPCGVVSIEATCQQDHAILRVSDDGRGLDLDRILEKAIERQLTTQDNAAHLTEREIQSFIFHPGLSTADQLNDISGRGVGMDVVHDTVRQLGGEIQVESKPGRGTTFTIILPR